MKFLLCLLPAFLFFACASVQSPQGGPKDSEAPILINTNPRNGEVRFTGKYIQLEYSENVTENDAKLPFLSPLTQVTVVQNGKKIRLIPDSGWKVNQTYELRLGKKIKDEREGNIAADTSILFSTGTEPDRIQLDFKVENLSGNLLSGKTTCLLFAENGSRYFGNGEGNIRISGLRAGRYLAEVFQDKNENLKYEEEDGRLFTDSINTTDSISIACRPLPQSYKGVRFFHQLRGDTLQIESSRPIRADSLLLRNLIAANEEKTLFLLYPFRYNLMMQHRDSLGSTYSDTLLRDKTDSSRTLSKPDLKRKVRIEKKGKELQTDMLWNWKVLKHPQKMEYTSDSMWNELRTEKLPFGLRINLPVTKAGKIKIRMDSISFYNQMSIRKDSIIVRAEDLEEPGSISGTIALKSANLVAELINQEKDICSRATGGGNFQWKVKPGSYQLIMYLDENRDGMYTGGNKKLQRKAEPLYLFPDKIELKSGWDLEKINVQPGF